MKTRNPKKQRRKRNEMALHLKKKLLNAPLSKGLKKELKRKKLNVKKGDEVKVLKGSKKGHIGKVKRVDLGKSKVFVDGFIRKRADGTELMVPVQASNLLIVGIAKEHELGERRKKDKKSIEKKADEEKEKEEKRKDIWSKEAVEK